MWIEPTKNGKFKACERYTDPFTGKVKKVSTTIEKDTRTARKAAEEVLRDKIEKLTESQKDESITLVEVRDRFVSHQKKTVREQTWRRDEIMVHTVTDILGADVKANTLSARYITQKLEASKKSNTTLNTYIKHIKKMLKWAYRNDYVDDVSYLDKLQPYPDKEKKARIEDKYLTSEELSKLLSAMQVDQWRLLTHFLALSGLRIGEALALHSEDIDKVIHVNKTMDLKSRVNTPSAKTDAGNRDVFIQPELAEVIRKIKLHNKIVSLQHNFRSDLLFPGKDGDPFNYFPYNEYLRKTTKAVIGRSLTPHALRHTHVSLLAENGVPLEVISRRVGHESSDITRQIYLHITEKQKEKDNEMLSKIKIL